MAQTEFRKRRTAMQQLLADSHRLLRDVEIPECYVLKPVHAFLDVQPGKPATVRFAAKDDESLICVPLAPGRPGDTAHFRANLLADSPDRILGEAIKDSDLTPERVEQRLQSEIALIQRCYEATQHPDLRVLLDWYEAGCPLRQPEDRAQIRALKPGARLVLSVDRGDYTFTHSEESIARWWATVRGDDRARVDLKNGKKTDYCPFTGKLVNPPLNVDIDLPGTNGNTKEGKKLFVMYQPSRKKPRYGWDRIGFEEKAAERILTTLRHLLMTGDHTVTWGDYTLVMWQDAERAEKTANHVEAHAESVKNVLRMALKGNDKFQFHPESLEFSPGKPGEKGGGLHIQPDLHLLLMANMGDSPTRAMLSYDTLGVGEILQRLVDFTAIQQGALQYPSQAVLPILAYADLAYDHLGFAKKNRPKNVYHYAMKILRSIVLQEPWPADWKERAFRMVRRARDVTPRIVAFIRLSQWYSIPPQHREKAKMPVSKTIREMGEIERFGVLFAIWDYMRQNHNKDAPSFWQRYSGTLRAQTRTTFATSMRLAESAYLPRLKREKPGLYIQMQQAIAGITGLCAPVPASLTQDQEISIYTAFQVTNAKLFTKGGLQDILSEIAAASQEDPN